MARNLSNEQQNKKAQQAAERRALRRRDALRAVMDTELGRLYLRALIEDCGVLEGGYDQDASHVYFAAGQRNIGLFIYAECQASAPNSFVLMEKELRARDASDKREDEAIEKEQDANG